MYEKELQNLGLTEKEAKVYTTALELGPDTVQNIAKESGINRATTYVQIESLEEKGLMSEFEKGKKTYYVAESPNRLKNLVGVVEKELEIKKASVNSIVPGLLALFESMGERPKVRFFEGVEGTKAMRDDFLKTKDKMIYGIIDYDKLFGLYPTQQEDYTNFRVKKKIRTRTYYTRKEGPLKTANSPKDLREAKYLDSKKVDISASITVYDNKVAISTYSTDPIGVIIESAAIAKTVKSLFELSW